MLPALSGATQQPHSIQQGATEMIKGNPSPQALHKVLDLLATSHDFREQMLGDPASALKAHGIEVDASQIPAVRKLPPMQEVAAIHKEQFDDPMGKVCISVFLLK